MKAEAFIKTKTFIKKEGPNRHRVMFTIGNQTFGLKVCTPDMEGDKIVWTSKQRAAWYRQQLETAFEKL